MENVTNVKKKSAFGTAALVLGIIGVCLSWIPIVNNAAFILGVLSAVFGIVALCKHSSKGLAIAGIVLGILSIIFTVVAQQAFSNAVNETIDTFQSSLDNLTEDHTEEILANSVDVQFGSFTVKKDSYFSEGKVVVNVKNKTDEKHSYSLTIEAVDKKGTRIDSDVIFADDLKAGQDQNFDCFTLSSSDLYDQLKTATFRVVEVSMY